MTNSDHPLAASATSDVTAVATTLVVGLAAVFAVVIFAGFGVLVRRSRRAQRADSPDGLASRADHALVRLDDEIAESVDELGFAEAQFGPARAAAMQSAIGSARSMLTSAFEVRQRIDRATAVSVSDRRDGYTRILVQCETALEMLNKERSNIDAMRRLERSASADLERVRPLIAATTARVPAVRATVSELNERFAASATAPISDHVPNALRMLESADAAATAATSRIDPAGGGDAAALIQDAKRAAERAAQLLDGIEAHAGRLRHASERLDQSISAARSKVQAAKASRDAAPDAVTAAAIGDMIGFVERTLSSVPPSRRDPDASIAQIEGALDSLDAALSTARSMQQRLTHAREALEAALFAARSQIEVTRAYIGARRGGVGADARTRLAEAERLLAVASVLGDSNPVAALDTARSSATYSRDADALARYDMLQ